MSKSSSWKGQQDLLQALQSLTTTTKPVPTSKVKAVVECAFKYQNEYKLVVYEIEKFLKKSDPADRLSVVFAIDSICRYSRERLGKEKDIFSSRFALRLKDTMQSVKEIPADDKNPVKRVLDEWSKREIFSQDLLASLDFLDFVPRPQMGMSTVISSVAPAQSTAASAGGGGLPIQTTPVSVASGAGSSVASNSNRPVDPRLLLKSAAAAIAAASSSSIVPTLPATSSTYTLDSKSTTESSVSEASFSTSAAAHTSAESARHHHHHSSRSDARAEKVNKQPAKLCPFKLNEGGSCSFGANCRFTHSEWVYQQSPALHLLSNPPAPSSAAVDSLRRIVGLAQPVEQVWLAHRNLTIPSLEDVATTSVFPILYRRAAPAPPPTQIKTLGVKRKPYLYSNDPKSDAQQQQPGFVRVYTTTMNAFRALLAHCNKHVPS